MWVSMDSTILPNIVKSRSLQNVRENISIFPAKESKLLQISIMMHKTKRGCGGFFLHNSFSEANLFAKKVKKLSLIHI